MSYNSYEALFNNMMNRTGKPAPAKTFQGWQKSAIAGRNTLMAVKRKYEADRDEALRDYSSTKAAEILGELQRNYESTRRNTEKWLRERFDAVVQSKRDAIKRACKAPSEEDLRMLQALKMRSKLTDNDIIRASEQLENNFVALGLLADIAESAGVNCPVFTAELAEEEIKNVERLGDDLIKHIDSEDKTMPYTSVCFYNYPDAETSVSFMFEKLDNNVFTSEQVRAKADPARMNTDRNTAGNE